MMAAQIGDGIMLKYIPEAAALVSIGLAIACIFVWASIIDHQVRSERGFGSKNSAKVERSAK
jgi:hypothetical protein